MICLELSTTGCCLPTQITRVLEDPVHQQHVQVSVDVYFYFVHGLYLCIVCSDTFLAPRNIGVEAYRQCYSVIIQDNFDASSESDGADIGCEQCLF